MAASLHDAFHIYPYILMPDGMSELDSKLESNKNYNIQSIVTHRADLTCIAEAASTWQQPS